MKFLYNSTIFFTLRILQIIALFNKKIKIFVEGRKETFSKISVLENQKNIWFHVASLGEFEQARPIIEAIKKEKKDYKILVTFFSPSGYEVRKDYPLADVICYLPLDSKANAKQFIKIVNPILTVFVKYEFWPNFLNELKQKNIHAILVSGIFRENQIFFKNYGGFMRNALTAFNHFFVQNENSKQLLYSINFTNITIAGDTRFDRVLKILKQDNSLDFVDEFTDNKYTLVAGSTWQEDENLLVNYINTKVTANEKYIIAPHTIKPESIAELQKSINKKSVLYSQKEGKNLKGFQVFIIDTIGILTKIYANATIAYVGGGLKTGLHNILEPATFGIPVVIGNNYNKFKEAKDLVALRGCFSIKNQQDFDSIFDELKNNKDFRDTSGNINKNYIQQNTGATQTIMNYISKNS